MEVSVQLIRQIDKLEPGLRDVLFAILEEIGRQRKERVTKDDFQELKQLVRDLVRAQARTGFGSGSGKNRSSDGGTGTGSGKNRSSDGGTGTGTGKN